MVQGLHIGQENPFPLPVLPIHGVKTEDIAFHVDMGLEILALVKGVSVEDVYKIVDTHMTDSTEDNKDFSKLLARMYNLDAPAGQLFCGMNTTLGFSGAMNKVLRLIEGDMKMEQVLQGFMVDMEFNNKNAGVAGQVIFFPKQRHVSTFCLPTKMIGLGVYPGHQLCWCTIMIIFEIS